METEIIERRPNGNALEAISRGEIESQIEVAKRYPRSIRKFRDEATALACLDEETAASCFYVLPGRRQAGGGKSAPIEGPSARFAEIAVSCWGNAHAGARVIGEDDNFVTAQGVFRDLERNTAVTFECRRRITTRDGNRYSDDMIAVTANAACSIALRNAAFKGIPQAFWKPIYEAARQTAIGKAESMASRRQQMIAYFGKMGVDAARVLAAIGKAELDQIGPDELIQLKGMATAIRDGDMSLEEVFPQVLDESAGKGVAAAAERLRQRREQPVADAQPVGDVIRVPGFTVMSGQARDSLIAEVSSLANELGDAGVEVLLAFDVHEPAGIAKLPDGHLHQVQKALLARKYPQQPAQVRTPPQESLLPDDDARPSPRRRRA